MVHPGPIAARRIDWAASRLIRIEQSAGKPGQSLLDVIARSAHAQGLSAGTGHIRHCQLDKTRFTTGGPARDGKAANYTFIRDWGTSHLPWATFSFGRLPDGARFVHCHAMIEDGQTGGAVGGHLFPADCLVSKPFMTDFFGLPDLDLVQRPDAETLHSVFEIETPTDVQGPDALFVRVKPNEDVTTAIETACRASGIDNAVFAPSLGSLNAPVLEHEDGTRYRLTSVGMEVLQFSGHLRDGRAQIDVVIVDEAGTPSMGRLVRGCAPICVTAEIALIGNAYPAAIS